MTTAHVEKFAELVGEAPALFAKLGFAKVNADVNAAAASTVAFITNAVQEAKAHGLEFTAEELNAFMAAQTIDAAKRRAVRYLTGRSGRGVRTVRTNYLRLGMRRPAPAQARSVMQVIK